ncbi:MAG TPA: hypothetical protein VF146_11755 [Bryobacteraceae bacterium]
MLQTVRFAFTEHLAVGQAGSMRDNQSSSTCYNPAPKVLMRNHSLSQIASIGTALSLTLFLAACGGGGYSGGGTNNNPPPNTATLAQNAAKHGLMVGAAADSPYLSDGS